MKKITSEDFISPKNMRDFSMFYKKLQNQGEPLIQIDDFFGMGKAWFVFHHDDAFQILKDGRFLKDMRKFIPQQTNQETRRENASINRLVKWIKNNPNMLSVDPPDHTRLRRLASKAFTPRMIEGMRPSIQKIADELLDNVMKNGKMELIADFAYPLPILVISEMLGIPKVDRNQFRQWTHQIGKAALNPDQAEVVSATFEDFIQYIQALIEKKRKDPSNDVISGLVKAYDEGDKLSKDELISTVWLLITAGHETTVNLISNGMLALLQHPQQMKLLSNDPTLLSSAVEELLRYASPVMIINRIAGEDILFHEKTICKGENVVISLAAANLDSSRYADSDVLDITRGERDHLAFSNGIHHCLGAPLARLEGKIAFGTLLQRLPNLQLAIKPEQLTYHASTHRSLTSLPVTF
jgi:cytochrome P450 PksS